MIDRTSLDLRIAEHTATTARVNRAEWRRDQPEHRPIRATLAGALVALAARLAPAQPAIDRRGQAERERPATA